MLEPLVNTFTADDKYSRRNREISPQQFQMQLSQKPKSFVIFSFRFWNLHQLLRILKKKHDSHSLSITESIDSERGGYLNL